MLKYMGPLIAVEDIAVSRRFYEGCLGQKVKYDFGVNVTFEGDFSIHSKASLAELLAGGEQVAFNPGAHEGELTFETDEIEMIEQKLREVGAKFIQPIQEQPWGQRAMRVCDPDGHLLEIGEDMQVVARRYHHQGASVESICQKTGMPRYYVEAAIAAAE
jgi:uncharacterized glyoxalase superfamily protein PhnB